MGPPRIQTHSQIKQRETVGKTHTQRERDRAVMEGHGGAHGGARESFGLIALSEPQIDGGAGLVSFTLVDYTLNPDPL